MKSKIRDEVVEKLYQLQLGTLIASVHRLAVQAGIFPDNEAKELIGSLSIVKMVEALSELTTLGAMARMTASWEAQGKPGTLEDFLPGEWERVREEVLNVYEWRN